jgi:2-phosphosulfolactate phosphatase
MVSHVPHVFAGALVNASAVARAVSALEEDATIIACGEEGRFALEDHLGAAAIAAAIEGERMPDKDWYRTALRGCLSGIELIDRGFGADVDHAASLDLLDVAPRLENGAYRA